METIEVESKDKKFKFRQPNDEDMLWIHSEYSQPGKKNGIRNFEQMVADFNNPQLMLNAIAHLMHHLNLDKYKDVETLINAFGSGWKDSFLLSKTMSSLFGNTDKEIAKYLELNTTITTLKYEVQLLKMKNKSLLKKLEKKNKKRRK